MSEEQVNHPQHYGGKDNPYEAIKVIEAWNLGFCLGNTVKYISRAGKKDKTKRLEDLKKALWYLQREVNGLTLDEPKHALTISNVHRQMLVEAELIFTKYHINSMELGDICVFIDAAKSFTTTAINNLESSISYGKNYLSHAHHEELEQAIKNLQSIVDEFNGEYLK